MTNSLFVSALLAAALFAAAPAGLCLAGVNIRVMVMDDLERLAVFFPGNYDVRDVTGQGVVSAYGAGGSRIELGPQSPLPDGIRIRAEGSVVSINEYGLTGIIDIRKNGRGRFTIINELGLEDYTRAVVGEEMGPRWPLEALKAQAVASRTYALSRKGRAGATGYDLCSTVDSQVFMGDAWLKDGPARAVEETRGLVLTFRGELAETLYHSSCGGRTEDASEVWAKGCRYLPGASCGCNAASPNASWTRVLSSGVIRDALVNAGYRVGDVRRVSVSKKSGSGRAAKVTVSHAGGTLEILGNDFRKALGYSVLPSTMFSAHKSGDDFTFTGSGSGHGVGLCQWGAKAFAEEGWSFEQILAHYYPELALSRIADGPEAGQ